MDESFKELYDRIDELESRLDKVEGTLRAKRKAREEREIKDVGRDRSELEHFLMNEKKGRK